MENFGKRGGGQEAGQGQRSKDFSFWELFIWILFFLNFLKLIAEFIGFVRFCRRPGPDREEYRGFGTSLTRTEIILAGGADAPGTNN